MIARLLTPPARFVLAIGNEGGVLLDLAGGRIRARWQVAGCDDAALAVLAAALAAAPRRPLLVLGDLLEQSYRREAVPRLNPIDRGKVLARRLERAFADAPLKAALRLADDPQQGRSQNYLLIGVPPGPDWSRWLDFLRAVDNPVTALSLLPVEAADLTVRLARALTPAGRTPNDWAVLITRQHTGGFRQVIVHRGELVLTRLTPSLAADASAVETAAEIRQELKATLGYMTRLGYRAGSSLDLVVLCEEALHGELGSVATPPGQCFVLSAAAAAGALGITARDDLADADGALLAALWLGRKRHAAVQLLPADLRARRMQGRALRLATAALAASALGLLSYSALSAASALKIKQEIGWLSAWHGTTRQQLARSESAADATAATADAMRALLEAHRRLTADQPDPFAALLTLRGALTRGEQLASVSWDLNPPAERPVPPHPPDGAWLGEARGSAAAGRQAPPQAVDGTLHLTLDLGALSEPGAAVAATEDLARRLAAAFPGRPVAVTRQAVDILPHQAFVGGSDRPRDAPLSADLRVGVGAR